MRRGKCFLNYTQSLFLRLIRNMAFNFFDVLIAGNDNMKITSFRSFRKKKSVTGMEMVKSAEDENFHGEERGKWKEENADTYFPLYSFLFPLLTLLGD